MAGILIVSLRSQPNRRSCGPFALKHGLVALGRLADERAITTLTKSHWNTQLDVSKLARAAQYFGCDLATVSGKDELEAHQNLVGFSHQSLPVLLRLDEQNQWVTVVQHESRRFVMLDSRGEPVINVVDWPRLRRRWTDAARCRADMPFSIHVLQPQSRQRVRARFSLARAQYLRRPENAGLAMYWDDYLGDLLEICCPRSSRRAHAVSMAEFLRRNGRALTDRLEYWHGDVDKEALARVFRNFRFVADTYGLVIPHDRIRQALVDVSVLLAFWATSRRGIEPMYEAAE